MTDVEVVHCNSSTSYQHSQKVPPAGVWLHSRILMGGIKRPLLGSKVFLNSNGVSLATPAAVSFYVSATRHRQAQVPSSSNPLNRGVRQCLTIHERSMREAKRPLLCWFCNKSLNVWSLNCVMPIWTSLPSICGCSSCTASSRLNLKMPAQ
jgi:hypothetical protein